MEEQKNKQTVTLAAAIITGAAMIALALILVLGSKNGAATNTVPAGQQQQQASNDPGTPTSIPADVATVRPSDTNHIRGDISKAQIVIFEYSDSDCPFCQEFHPTLQKIVNDYQGKVAWVYRFFPLDIHPDSHNEALALQCVSELGGAKAFNPYLDSLMNITLTPNDQTMTTLGTFAAQQGIDTNKFATCVADPATKQFVDNSIQEAETIGAQGTPFSVIVNIKTGKQAIIPGAYPYDQVKKAIDSLM